MQRGLTLYLSIIIMAILLALVLGLTAISVTQLKMTRGIENSVVAFYAADTGIEQALKAIIYDREVDLVSSYNGTIDIGAGPNNPTYWADVVCCSVYSLTSYNLKCNFRYFDVYNVCQTPEDCPAGLNEDSDCSASRYCIRSKGDFKGVQRAIETTYGADTSPLYYYTYNAAAEGGGVDIYEDTWGAQTFTTTEAFTIRRVGLELCGNGFMWGPEINFVVTIWETDADGHPSSPLQCDAWAAADLLASECSSYGWIGVDLSGTECNLSVYTKYAIVVWLNEIPSDETNCLRWNMYNMEGYSGGNVEYSNDAGSNWSSTGLDDYDHMFQICR